MDSPGIFGRNPKRLARSRFAPKKRGSTPWRFIIHNLKNLKAWTVPRSLAETQKSQHQVGLLFSIAETRKPGQSRGRKRHGGVSVSKECV